MAFFAGILVATVPYIMGAKGVGGGNTTKWLTAPVLASMCHWAVDVGLPMVEKFFSWSSVSSRDSVCLVIRLVVDGMVDNACRCIPSSTLQSTSSLRTSLDGVSRKILGSIEQHATKHNLNHQRAAALADAWKKLQHANRTFADQARKLRKLKVSQRTQQRPKMQVSSAPPSTKTVWCMCLPLLRCQCCV